MSLRSFLEWTVGLAALFVVVALFVPDARLAETVVGSGFVVAVVLAYLLVYRDGAARLRALRG